MKDPIEEAFMECDDSPPVESEKLASELELVTLEDRVIGSSSTLEGGNMDIDLNFTSKPDWSVVSQLPEEQIHRFESFRRSKFNRDELNKLLVSVSGDQKISKKVTIAVSACAKMFVGDLVEKARVVMTESNESGPIQPCHMQEAYRRLKIEGKLPTL